MKELMVTNKQLTMSSREIAALTGKQHSHVFRDIRKMLEELEIEHQEYIHIWTHPQNKQSYEEYVLGRKPTDCLLTGYSAKARMKVIDRWHELESKPAFQIPQTLGEALQLAADQAKQLELAAPKVAFVDNCVERGELMTATQVAQKHKMSAVKLNKFLDELECVYNRSVKRGRAFKTCFVTDGFGEMKQTEMGYSQTLFTASGEQWINQQLIKEGVI